VTAAAAAAALAIVVPSDGMALEPAVGGRRLPPWRVVA